MLEKDIHELNNVFFKYKTKTGFDFNTADSLIIFYQTDIQSQLREFLIVSGMDTVSFAEDWKRINLHQYEREIIYKPFFMNLGYKVNYVDDRDTLLALVIKKDLVTARKLEKEHPVLDGAGSTIITAKKIDEKYSFDEHYFHPIGLIPVYKKE